MLEPEWTTVRPSLKQKSTIEMDPHLLGNVLVDNTDIGCSDHFSVRTELGRTTKTFKEEKRVIRRWCLERFEEYEVKLRYQNALKAEVHGFIKSKLEGGMKGHDLVSEVYMDWENIVNRVAKGEVKDKMIVYGRTARWWDDA